VPATGRPPYPVTRRGGGIGLGLFIARQIATAHGGSIEARSADGATTFTVRLPRRASGADS
jgi:signal transduction histidine kinase